jgi:hypothetical protein
VVTEITSTATPQFAEFNARGSRLLVPYLNLIITRGRWLMQVSRPAFIPVRVEWTRIRKNFWDEIMEFFLLIVSSGLEGSDLYRCSYPTFPCSRVLHPIDPILDRRKGGDSSRAPCRGTKMHLFTIALIAASAVVWADTDNHGHPGWGSHPQAFIPSFDNLVAFGDR